MNQNSPDCCAPIPRREFIKVVGLGAAALAALRMPVMAGPFEAADFD